MHHLRTPKTLNQRHRTGVGGLFCKTRVFDQMGGNDALDNPQHPAHDGRTTGEQETQRIRESCSYLNKGRGDTNTRKSRRNVLKGIAINLPATCTTPIVESVVLPVHAGIKRKRNIFSHNRVCIYLL